MINIPGKENEFLQVAFMSCYNWISLSVTYCMITELRLYYGVRVGFAVLVQIFKFSLAF